MLELLKFIGIKVKINKSQRSIELTNKKLTINTLAPYKLVKNYESWGSSVGTFVDKI